MNTESSGNRNFSVPERPIPIYQVLAEDIKSLGAEAVFGLVSDDTAALVAQIDTLGVRFYGSRHENNAIAMAEGYAYATGRLGIALVGRGPATANGLNAAVSASRSGSAVLLIYGDAAVPGGAANALGPDYKAFDAIGVLSAAGLRTFVATSANAARGALTDAVAAARLGALATLHLPTDVQLAELVVRKDDRPPMIAPVTRPALAARPQSIQASVALLEKSSKPLIIAGLGAHLAGARDALVNLAQKTGALLITSARGKDMFRGNPYSLGIIGSFSHSAARRLVDQSDCVIVFGAGLNFLTMSFGTALPQVPLIHVDAVRAHIGRWWYADVAVVGDAKRVAEQLNEMLPVRSGADKPFHSEETLRTLAAFDLSQDFQATPTARTLDPRSLGIELDKLLPPDRNLVYDAGNFMGIVPYISVPGPGHFKLTSDFSSIGLGFGTALGVAAGRPERTTVLIIGDGGFLMTMGELETVVREDLPLVIVLMNDCAYGAELHLLKMRQLPVAKSVFPDVDFAPIAEGFGFHSATIRTLDDLRKIAPILKGPQGPVFLDCKINAAIAAPFMSEFAHFEGRR